MKSEFDICSKVIIFDPVCNQIVEGTISSIRKDYCEELYNVETGSGYAGSLRTGIPQKFVSTIEDLENLKKEVINYYNEQIEDLKDKIKWTKDCEYCEL